MILLNKFLTCNTRDIYVCSYTQTGAILTVKYTKISIAPVWSRRLFRFESTRYPYTINEKGRLISLNYEKKGILSIRVYFNNGGGCIDDSYFVVSCLNKTFIRPYTDERIKMIVSEWAKNEINIYNIIVELNPHDYFE